MIVTLDNGIEISYEPLPTLLPSKLGKIYKELSTKAHTSPKEVKAALEDLYKAHPELPEVANLLTYVYIQLKEIKKAEALIAETYKNHPTHLLAKINYADQCLRQKQKERVASLFPDTDLFKLYPERKTFHISEYRSFMVLMGFYHLALLQRKSAEEYYLLACRADLTHPSVAALEKKLFRPTIKVVLQKYLRLLIPKQLEKSGK